MPEEFDIDKSIYRRFYAGFRNDPRTNSVSMEAGFLYMMTNLIADDWGNLPRSREFIREEALAGRPVSDTKMASMLAELEAPSPPPLIDKDAPLLEPLIRPYEAQGRRLYHIVDFLKDQPAARNGRRYRRYPASPWDLAPPSTAAPPQRWGNPGESGFFRGNPGEPGEPTAAATEPATEPAAAAPAAENAAAAVADFTQRGIDAETATWAVGGFEPDEIARAFRAFDEKRSRERIRNPSGLLRKFLLGGCSPPLEKKSVTASVVLGENRRREAQWRAELQAEQGK